MAKARIVVTTTYEFNIDPGAYRRSEVASFQEALDWEIDNCDQWHQLAELVTDETVDGEIIEGADEEWPAN